MPVRDIFLWDFILYASVIFTFGLIFIVCGHISYRTRGPSVNGSLTRVLF